MNHPSEPASAAALSPPGPRRRRAFSRRQIAVFWLPLLATLFCLVLAMLPYPWSLRHAESAFGLGYLAGLLWFLGLAVARFAKRQVAAGFAALGGLATAVAALIPAAVFSLFAGMAGDSHDGFADDLAPPANVELTEPLDSDRFNGSPGAPADTFQAAVHKSLELPGGDDASVTLAIPSLEQLRSHHASLLERFLAAHPGWRVYREDGNRFATRRWMVGNQWRISLHGYYGSFGSHGSDPDFQARTTIGLSGKPWNRPGQRIQPGSPTTVSIREGNRLHESHIMLSVGDLLVEQFEQSSARERRITRASMAELEREFAKVLFLPDWEVAKGLLPDNAITRGEASMALYNSGQPGIYNAEIRCNPGEPGRVYLQAWELTRNYRLSTHRLEERSNEWVGWSDDPKEQFLSETHFTIYEGDWGQYYGARFEVWFEPDAGGKPRKLLQHNFKIEGWMR